MATSYGRGPSGSQRFYHRLMHVHERLYIGGTWAVSTGDGSIDVFDSVTEEVMGRVPEGTVDDVARAVAAARGALDGWSGTPVEERAKHLERLAEGLTARMADVGVLIAREVGMPLQMATLIQGGVPAIVMGSYAETVRSFPFEEKVGNSVVVREPVGVVAGLTPWNFPLHQAVAKVAPALAAGCPIVLKPSEVAPLTAFVLAEVVDDAGLPPGVFNLVTGYGPVVGEALVTSPGVDMVSFTGSTPTGRRVAELAASRIRRVTLELGGKSPNVVLDDADLAEAVQSGVRQCFLNNGQACIAWSRMLVPRHLHDQAVELARSVAERYSVGDPLDGSVGLGPLASKAQWERVRAYIRTGVEEGATLVTGGAEPPPGLERGWYVRPTIFAGVDNGMTIAREEIFGPVLAILPYDDEDDAVRIANDTVYGLHAGVYSGDKNRAVKVARRLQAGQVDVNGGGYNPLAPFGGYKQSGLGREMGRHGLEAYLETKSLQL